MAARLPRFPTPESSENEAGPTLGDGGDGPITVRIVIQFDEVEEEPEEERGRRLAYCAAAIQRGNVQGA